MSGQPQRKRKSAWAAILFFNVVTILIAIAFFFPQWLPFLSSTRAATVVVPAKVAPVDGTLSDSGQPVVAGKPVHLRIPSVNIDIPVADGLYNAQNGKWTLSTDKAHYAVMTPIANNTEGNTFIYGHNRKSVFARLLNVKPGDKAYIETDNKKVFEYTMREHTDVEPTDVSLFLYEGKPILTLQTCTGTWYQDRRLFTFDFVKVEDKV
jgi:LPXTG-site transpeptidase (sortase) family protein